MEDGERGAMVNTASVAADGQITGSSVIQRRRRWHDIADRA
jgi:hypothetical protein